MKERFPCRNRRGGCVGYVVPETCKYRAPDGSLSERLVMVCNKCEQAHGPADAGLTKVPR